MPKVLSLDYIKTLIPRRVSNSHKGNYGKILIIASSKRYIGAGCICTNSCMRSGSGLVTIAVEDDIFQIVSGKLNEAMVLNIDAFPLQYHNLLNNVDVIAIGCGLANRRYTLDKLLEVLMMSTCPLVLDADALNSISENKDILDFFKTKDYDILQKIYHHTDSSNHSANISNKIDSSNKKVILTPHEGEFSRLSGYTIKEIQDNKLPLSIEFAKQFNVTLVLKGKETIITDGNVSYICDIGVPEMATGGMGDCLTGIITSFVGQGLCPIDACNLGVFLHSYIARNLSERMYSILATDIIKQIPFALKTLANK